MLKIYLSDELGVLEEKKEITRGCWVNLISPTEDEIIKLSNELDLPIEFLKDPLDEEERSRIEKDEGNILIIVNIPLASMDEHQNMIYDTIPLGIIFTKGCFITVCLKDNPILQSFTKNKLKNFFTFKKTRFSLQILYFMATSYLKFLKQISKLSDTIEKELHESMKNKELFSLLNLEKSLVYFTTSLKSNNYVMQKILRGNYLKMYEDDQELLEDVIIEHQQAIEMADTYTNILSSMMDAFASVISNNVNNVMKLLTSITIIMAIPTMVASFYGMNVAIPFQNYQHSFLFAIILSFVLSSVTAVIFWKKKFF
ncbi:magnesium transporter CorA family protein [Caldifermentibacillus hisashii]|uniref:magnesium transporter CorA family protein n=1 Tax=Caldifermentibacillus hisashii TaxID=996558 RepID=UPI0031B67A9C